MTPEPATTTLPARDQAPAAPVAQAVLALLVGLIGLLLVGHRSFQIKPAGDAFPYVEEIRRGDTEGPAALITRSFTWQTYRPLTSLAIWLAGRGSPEGRPARLR